MHTAIDPKVVEAIKGIRSIVKQMAREQKQDRLAKKQKDVGMRVRITVLHRLYLKIRNRPFEEVHRIRKGWEDRAVRYEKEYIIRLGLE